MVWHVVGQTTTTVAAATNDSGGIDTAAAWALAGAAVGALASAIGAYVLAKGARRQELRMQLYFELLPEFQDASGGRTRSSAAVLDEMKRVALVASKRDLRDVLTVEAAFERWQQFTREALQGKPSQDARNTIKELENATLSKADDAHARIGARISSRRAYKLLQTSER